MINLSKQKVFLIVQSILCILTALLLAAAAVSIYREGAGLKAEDPLHWIFTREAAVQRLIPILLPLVLSLVLTAAGLVLGALLPAVLFSLPYCHAAAGKQLPFCRKHPEQC